MPYVKTKSPIRCRHCDKDVSEWYAQPSDGRIITSGKCAACYRASRAARAAVPQDRSLLRPASSVAREQSDQAWEPLIAAVAAVPGRDAQRHQLLKHSLRLVT